jgi:hypothetical protein
MEMCKNNLKSSKKRKKQDNFFALVCLLGLAMELLLVLTFESQFWQNCAFLKQHVHGSAHN